MPVEMTYTETLVVTHCWCGIALAIPENLHRFAKTKPTDVYCPLGHIFVFRDTYKEQYEAEQRRHQATKDLLEHEEKSHAATRGHLTRQRKRAQAGICPCCNRSFQQLARHMKTKHPDFRPEETPA
jgi:hypothetical protein